MISGSRSRKDRRSDEIDSIYDSALDEHAFGKLSSVLASGTQSANGVLVLRRDDGPVELSATISADAQRAYLDYYGKIDIWTNSTAGVPPLVISETESFISDADVLRSEFYVDYARHLDMFRPIGARALIAPGMMMVVGVNRPRTSRKYTRTDKRSLLELTRHIQRAIQLRRRFQFLEDRASVGFAALQHLAFGVLVIEPDGSVRFVNSAAEELQRERAGIVLRHNRLSTELPQDGLALSALLRSVWMGDTGGAMQVRQNDGTPGLFVLVSPLPRRLAEPASGGNLALVALRRANESVLLVESVLTCLFGFSPVEAEIARGIMRGERLEVIAATRGVQMSTIRTQVESIFRKASVESQRELVRVLGGLPQLRGFVDVRTSE